MYLYQPNTFLSQVKLVNLATRQFLKYDFHIHIQHDLNLNVPL